MIRRGFRKPPRVIFERLSSELRAELARFRAPSRGRLGRDALLQLLSDTDLDKLWCNLAERPYPALSARVDQAAYEGICPGSFDRILAKADDAISHRVELLGSGRVMLGRDIDWHTDFKTGFGWPVRYFRDIEYNNPERQSDVKVPWELSRLQWLIPVGQAYLLTGEERYAVAVGSIIEHWIDSNPYACSVNWACTMEVALRILTWTWFFHVFAKAESWAADGFREKFLRSLFLHVEFTEQHIERSDVNGNHFTADAAGLVFGGLFFGQGHLANHWQQLGWEILSEEIKRQVYEDGVDFEASVPYHRLVTELFYLPALYRERLGLSINAPYQQRLEAMGKFTAAYTKPNGLAPLWGDADDARALPFGYQDINDHRYLIGIIGVHFKNTTLLETFSGSKEEIFWLFGGDVNSSFPLNAGVKGGASTAFKQGGFYVLRNANDHVFVDCGPIGLSGRGGHGHNDCLSFEAVLNGVPLISDCGAYVYTASYEDRNAFRSTAYHNTPQIDGEEINRFIRPDYLWNLHYDALPYVETWSVHDDHAVFIGQHAGYHKLASSVTPRRTIALDFKLHAILIRDEFIGQGTHDISIPLHLTPDVDLLEVNECRVRLGDKSKRFDLYWPTDAGYQFSIEDGQLSRSYGVIQKIKKMRWKRENSVLRPLSVFLAPEGVSDDFEKRLFGWLPDMRS
nr:alginate lyase family protein [Thalassospira xiamenensis]